MLDEIRSSGVDLDGMAQRYEATEQEIGQRFMQLSTRSVTSRRETSDMGLQLPSELTMFLQMVGYNWPQADETKLFEMGQKWSGFSSTLNEVMTAADTKASQVWDQNAGQDIQAFSDHWSMRRVRRRCSATAPRRRRWSAPA